MCGHMKFKYSHIVLKVSFLFLFFSLKLSNLFLLLLKNKLVNNYSETLFLINIIYSHNNI